MRTKSAVLSEILQTIRNQRDSHINGQRGGLVTFETTMILLHKEYYASPETLPLEQLLPPGQSHHSLSR